MKTPFVSQQLAPSNTSGAFRTERDFLGSCQVPEDAYWGVHTLRALENFQISGRALSNAPELIHALACVKEAAAKTNHELGLLNKSHLDVILRACSEIQRGELSDQFPVDLIQGGAGTSSNMNMNEVIANRALEHLNLPKGTYSSLHPNDHINLSQSTNDVYPTALKIAAISGIDGLLSGMGELRRAFEEKANEFSGILKVGRTQLQDAVPMTLGQEFQTYAIMIGEDESRLREARELLLEINLGATAIGTGIASHPDYASCVQQHLVAATGLPLKTAQNLIEATQDCGAFVQVSGVLKRIAVKLSKVCNDLRLLSSGPRAGLSEINLPARQAGSSIMPGKVNPVIPEVVNQVAFEVIGNDVTISMAAEGGQLQLNAFEPIIFYSFYRSLSHLKGAVETLSRNCVRGITANQEKLEAVFRDSVGIATALIPYIGYSQASKVASEASSTGQSVYELVLQQGLMSSKLLHEALSPENLIKPVDVLALSSNTKS